MSVQPSHEVVAHAIAEAAEVLQARLKDWGCCEHIEAGFKIADGSTVAIRCLIDGSVKYFVDGEEVTGK